MATVPQSDPLHRIDYLLNLCTERIQNLSNPGNEAPPLTTQQISKEAQQFLESYTKCNLFQLVKKAKSLKERALNIFEYKCIKYNMFIIPRIARNARFSAEIKPKLLSSSSSSILDIGCCFGTDLRYCLYLGCNKQQILGVDLRADFINLGFEFYGDRHELQERFISVNVFQNNGRDFIERALQRNNNRRFDVIHIGAVFHLLTESEGHLLTELVASLISKEGGIVYGSTVGCDVPGNYDRAGSLRYLHSRQSLQEMLQKYGRFKEVSVEVNESAVRRMTRFREQVHSGPHRTFLHFVCCV